MSPLWGACIFWIWHDGALVDDPTCSGRVGAAVDKLWARASPPTVFSGVGILEDKLSAVASWAAASASRLCWDRVSSPVKAGEAGTTVDGCQAGSGGERP